MVFTILSFLLLLSVLVLVHEFGHFWVARKSGMKVEEFGFGFPPRLFGWKKGDTTYSINAIPLGGFVRIKGESGAHRDDTDSFASKPAWKRFLVLIAGVAMNFLLAIVLLSVGFMAGLPSTIDGPLPNGARVSGQAVHIMSVYAGSPAARAGILADDTLVAIDGASVTDADIAQSYMQSHAANGVDLSLKHDVGDAYTVHVVSEEIAAVNRKAVGIGLATTGFVSFSPLYAIAHGFTATIAMTQDIFGSFQSLIVGLVKTHHVDGDVSGPVGIAVMTGKAASMGITYFLQFAALLSINLAVLNVLPLPALDGGRIFFLLLEVIRRKTVHANVEALVHNVGFLALLLLVFVVTYHDIVRAISGA